MSTFTKYRNPILWMILGIAISGILGVSLLMWCGFRATNAPSRFETAIALAVRNHSIPRRERRRKNPLLGDSAALQQGRELFLARCATCHGIGGGGLTAIGVNLSPRAPDLRQTPTQSLTDDQIVKSRCGAAV